MTGVGRGRGWLNLKTGAVPQTNPGFQGCPSPPNASPPPDQYGSPNSEFSDVNDFLSIVTKIKQLDLADDGIKFNQKIRYIVESWSEDCKNDQQVAESFDIIHDACLTDADLATKVVLLIASRTFLNQTIHENNIRLMFLSKLQNNFESCVPMQKQNPHAFRNSVQMMGEFYNKARMANGQQFAFMASPLCSYLELLLESADLADLRLFAVQLYSNGASLKAEVPDQIVEILNKTRLLLCTAKKLTKECRLWLLLALEVASNRFALLPADVQKFYNEQLGENNMAYFQGTQTVLSVQTHQGSKKLDTYQSNVNVLQVSDTSSNDSQNVTSATSNDSVTEISQPALDATSNTSGFHSDSNDSCHVNNFVKDLRSKLKNGGNNKATTKPGSNNQQSHSKPTQASHPTGRPILGVGARLQRNRLTSDNSTATDTATTNAFENSWRDSKQRVSKDRDTARDNVDDVESRNHSKNNLAAKSYDQNWRDSNKKNNKDRQQRNFSEEKDVISSPDNKGASSDSWDDAQKEQGKKSGNDWSERNRQRKSSGGDWKDKNQRKSSGGDWDNKKKNYVPKQNNRAWGHDDRFETDYS